MYVPDVYRTDTEDWARLVIRRYPLAALVTNGPGLPHVTHVPIIHAPDSEPVPLVGATLLGHMNRANPHWAALLAGAEARLVFTGPQSYISPASYQVEPAAPTWNFVVVHVTGWLEPVNEAQEVLDLVTATARTYETEFSHTWDPLPSRHYHRALSRGVGAFRIEVTAVDTMLKLSQEKPADIRARVIDALDRDGPGMARDLALLMRQVATAHNDH